jgi:hypothetical protein
MNKYCPRCDHYALETLRTHSHCLNCNYSPDCDSLKQSYDVVPNWVIPHLNNVIFGATSSAAKKLVVNFSIALCLILTSGCLAKKELQQPVVKAEPQISPKLEFYGLEAIIKAFPDFNRYLVKISWPGDLIGDSWVLSRRNNNQTTELARIEKEKTSFTDETVKGGELYTYFLNSVEKDGLKIIGEKTVTVPIDYLIDGDTFPAEIKNANRIFVPKKVILKSNGKNLSWKANEIFIDDTFTIDTTPPYKRLLPGEDGQSCSTIDIKAKKVVGDLNVECRPQDGADGADGMNGKHGEPGKKGQPGDVELKPSNEWKSPLNDWQIANMKNWYVSGQLPTGTKPDRFSWELWFKCSKAPTKGGDGENGENGKDGGAGGKGGNNSKMTFEIDEPIGFSVGSSTKSGAAGLGGRGGNGGKGGVGGPPGDPDPSGFLCPVSTEFGKTGVDGHHGREGKTGLNGQKWVTKWIYKGGGICGGFWK